MNDHQKNWFEEGHKAGFWLGFPAGIMFTIILAAILMLLPGCATTPTTQPGDPEIWNPDGPAQPVEAY